MSDPLEDMREAKREMLADEPFMEWLKEVYPDWESEYSGNLIGLHDAWKAGMEHQRDEDRRNHDPFYD
jgi:hypothetical protein